MSQEVIHSKLTLPSLSVSSVPSVVHSSFGSGGTPGRVNLCPSVA